MEARPHSPRMRAEVRHMGGCSAMCAHCFAAVLQDATGPRLPTACRVARWTTRRQDVGLDGSEPFTGRSPQCNVNLNRPICLHILRIS